MASNGKRRLSNGSALLGPLPDEFDDKENSLLVEDDDEFVGKPKSRRRSMGGRRSSIGGRRRSSVASSLLSVKSPFTASAEQARLAEMYKTVIKMSSENKITAKNSWSLDLIDHMDKLIDEENDRGRAQVNFQKASCTLDASIKIYSYRVDDTWSASYRILENLNRTDSDQPKQAKVGTKATSSKLCLVNTLEKNPANLNMSKLEMEFDIDPMFHKMAQTFDEGGAKGMLLVNLRVNNGCKIVFEEIDTAEQKPADAALKPSAPDMAWLANVLPSPADIAERRLCPSLQRYKETLFGPQQLASALPAALQASAYTGGAFQAAPATATSAPAFSNSSSNNNDDDYDDHVEADNIYEQIDTLLEQDDGPSMSDDADWDNNGNTPPQPMPAFDWNTVFEDKESDTAQSAAFRRCSLAVLERLCQAPNSTSEYSFFDKTALSTLQGQNTWAGAAHWKHLRTRKKPSKQAEDADSEEAGAAATKRTRSKPTPATLDFTAPFPDASLFAVQMTAPGERKRADPTILTQVTRQRNRKLMSDGAYRLPRDAELQVVDLCRLFTIPNTVVWRINAMNCPAGIRQKYRSVKHIEDDVYIANGVLLETAGRASARPQPRFSNSGDDYDNGDDYGLAPGGDDGYDSDAPAASAPQAAFVPDAGSGGNEQLAGMQLLQASRKVEKIDIKYETVAKKVDVRLLKENMWAKLENTVSPSKSMSFQGVVQELSREEKQSEVTVPFYFICLLHLANEHSLKLESSGLQDFMISRD